jgi:hypothetical protein
MPIKMATNAISNKPLIANHLSTSYYILKASADGILYVSYAYPLYYYNNKQLLQNQNFDLTFAFTLKLSYYIFVKESAMKKLTQKQKDILKKLYDRGARTESDLKTADYTKVQKLNDFENLPAEINTFLWDYHWSVVRGE